MTAMQFGVEPFSIGRTEKLATSWRLLGAGAKLVKIGAGEVALSNAEGCRDTAAPVAGVMLHLRFCYVSKAAILPVPVQPVPVENRSPA
jgi:hypothetical protein